MSRCYGRRHWRRWRLTRRIVGWLYQLGITYHGGSTGTHCEREILEDRGCQGHPPEWGWVVHGPGLRGLDPRKRRPYVLGMDTDVLCALPRCLRRGHWPLMLSVLGPACGRCMPWPCCGAVGDGHAADCPEEAA